MTSCDRARHALRVGSLALALAGMSRAESGAAGAVHPETCNATDRRTDALRLQLRAQGEALDRCERISQDRERTEAATRREISARLQELETLRLRVEERLARLEAATDARVARLADLYGRMPPERAAAVIDALDPDLAARIVSRMRPVRAAGVLAALPGAHAAELSRRIVRPRETTAAAKPLAETDSARRRMGSGAASAP